MTKKRLLPLRAEDRELIVHRFTLWLALSDPVEVGPIAVTLEPGVALCIAVKDSGGGVAVARVHPSRFYTDDPWEWSWAPEGTDVTPSPVDPTPRPASY
jgi:hypothetical protein